MNDQTRKALELAKAAIFRMDIFGNEDETTAAIDAALSAPAATVAQGEPVAWLYDYTDSDGDCRTSATHRDPRVIYAHELHRVTNIRPLGEIAAPAAPVARPLTDKQITEVINDHFLSSGNATSGEMVMRFARAIERAHGISQGGDNA